MPSSQPGTTVLSIDLAFADGVGISRAPCLRALNDVCEALAAADLPATWGVPAAGAPESEAFRRECGRGEWAVFVPAIGAGVGNDTLAAQLGESVRQAQIVGHLPTTLVVPEIGPNRELSHHDLLLRHGINRVRVDAPAGREARTGWWRRRLNATAQLRSLRWGLTELSNVVRLRQRGLSATRRCLEGATRGDFVVIVIDAKQISSGARDVVRLIEQVGRLSGARALLCHTIAGALAERAINRRPAARSILRPAA